MRFEDEMMIDQLAGNWTWSVGIFYFVKQLADVDYFWCVADDDEMSVGVVGCCW